MNEFSSPSSPDSSHWPLETKHLDSSSVICDSSVGGMGSNQGHSRLFGCVSAL